MQNLQAGLLVGLGVPSIASSPFGVAFKKWYEAGLAVKMSTHGRVRESTTFTCAPRITSPLTGAPRASSFAFPRPWQERALGTEPTADYSLGEICYPFR